MAKIHIVGEAHIYVSHHKEEYQIIQQCFKAGQLSAIALEAIEQRRQPIVNDFLKNKLTLREFRNKLQWYNKGYPQGGFGWPFTYYAPILLFAKRNRIPIICVDNRHNIHRLIDDALRKIYRKLGKIYSIKGRSFHFRNKFIAQVLVPYARRLPGTIIFIVGELHVQPIEQILRRKGIETKVTIIPKPPKSEGWRYKWAESHR